MQITMNACFYYTITHHQVHITTLRSFDSLCLFTAIMVKQRLSLQISFLWYFVTVTYCEYITCDVVMIYWIIGCEHSAEWRHDLA